MKNLHLFIVALSFLVAALPAQAEDFQYVDAATLTVIGKAFPTNQYPFRRIEDFDFRQESVNRKATHSTGVAVVFKNKLLIHSLLYRGGAAV